MNEADRYKITSEDYADIILDNWNDPEVMQKFANDVVNKINDNIAFAYIPIDRVPLSSFNQFGYYSIPGCFGLLGSDINEEAAANPGPYNLEESSGKGVLIGFVDTGIDYRHPAFRKSDNTTKIISIWDQNIKSLERYPDGLYYGTEYNSEEINFALQKEDPLSVIPSTDDIGHGTMMAGIACGTRNDENNFRGIAPEAELIIVKLKPAKQYLKEILLIPDGIPCYQENDIMAGVEYLNRIAAKYNKPIVICLGVGNNIVDHAGLRIGSKFYARIGEKPGCVFLAAAGNEANRQNHYYGNITGNSISDFVELQIAKDDPGFMIQFWGISPNFFWIDIYLPSGEFLVRIPPIDGQTTIRQYDKMLVIADSIVGIPSFHNQSIIFRVYKPVEGNWTFMVFGSMGDLPREFHLWLTLHNYLHEGTYFLKPNIYTTIVGPGNNTGIITVSCYDPSTGELNDYSSRGFNVDGIPKPDITAPGVNIPVPFLNNSYVSASGSSIAAAFTAGVSAHVLQWGIVEGRADFLNTPHVKHIFQLSAKRQKDMKYPNEDWGYGILNPSGIINTLKDFMNI